MLEVPIFDCIEAVSLHGVTAVGYGASAEVLMGINIGE